MDVESQVIIMDGCYFCKAHYQSDFAFSRKKHVTWGYVETFSVLT